MVLLSNDQFMVLAWRIRKNFPVGTSPIFIVDGSSSSEHEQDMRPTGSVDVRIAQNAKSKPLRFKSTNCPKTTCPPRVTRWTGRVSRDFLSREQRCKCLSLTLFC